MNVLNQDVLCEKCRNSPVGIPGDWCLGCRNAYGEKPLPWYAQGLENFFNWVDRLFEKSKWSVVLFTWLGMGIMSLLAFW